VEDYAPWINIGLNIDQTYDDDTFNWRDEEVLKNFKTFGLDRYAKINIWYINWEKKRQHALKMGLQNLPSFEIVDPRSPSTRLAHKFLNKYQMYPFWTIDFFRLVISKGAKKIKYYLTRCKIEDLPVQFIKKEKETGTIY